MHSTRPFSVQSTYDGNSGGLQDDGQQAHMSHYPQQQQQQQHGHASQPPLCHPTHPASQPPQQQPLQSPYASSYGSSPSPSQYTPSPPASAYAAHSQYQPYQSPSPPPSQHPNAPSSLYQTNAQQVPQQQHAQQQPHSYPMHQAYSVPPHPPAHSVSAVSAFSSSAASAVPPASSSSGVPDVVLIGDRCARLWGMLWHPSFKLRLSIPDSILFCNGAFHSYLFSARKHGGEIRKKSFAEGEGAQAAPKMTLENIRATLVRKAEQDPSNVTPFVAILQEHDARVSCVKYHALPRVLRSMGALPESHRLAQASFAGIPHQAVDIDLYQLLRAYVHPLGGVRFVTTYAYTPDTGNRESSMSSHARPQQHGAPPRHSLSTIVGRFAERYEVLPEERAFYDTHGGAADGREESKESGSSGAWPAVNSSILRECERMTLTVVEFLSRIHGVGVSQLALEFVQNYQRKLVLHAIVEVVFQVEPALAAPPTLGMQLVRNTDEEGEDMWAGPESATSAEALDSFNASHTAHSFTAQEPSDFASTASSAAPSRPASASVAGGRTARAARAMGASASSAVLASSGTAVAPAPYAPAALSRSGYNTSTSHAVTARPTSARARRGAPSQSGASSARFSSEDLEEQFRSAQPPRGVIGVSSSTSAALPRTARQKVLAGASKSGIAFTTLMQFETRTEMDERLSAGGLRPTASGIAAAENGSVAATTGNRADFLLFHWRAQAREGHAEVVRLNAELESASQAWAAKEKQLMALLHMEEKKVALLSSQNQSGQVEIESLRHSLDEHRLKSAADKLEWEKLEQRLSKDNEVQRLLAARLEEQLRKVQDELLHTAKEKTAGDSDAARLRKEVADAQRARVRADAELQTAQRVRDELLEKLESEEKFARNLAQQLDLMADWDSFEDMRHLMTKAAGLARNEGARLKEMDALRASVVKYTKDRGWQEKKQAITRQAKAVKKGHAAAVAAAAAAGAAGVTAGPNDPVPERRATDIIAERALNRMTH